MPYILAYTFLSVLAINNDKIKNKKIIEYAVFLFLIIFLGFRWETGGDFLPYLNYFDDLESRAVFDNPLFYTINLLSFSLNTEILGTNLILSTLFIFPLFYSLKKLKTNIYFYLCVAFPILILVYGMGSIRQGLAMVYFMLFLIYDGNKYIKYFLLILPVAFHDTAVFLILIYLLSLFAYKIKFSLKDFKLLLIILSLSLIFFVIFFQSFNQYITYYIVEDQYHSRGGFIRSALILIPAFIYLRYRKNNSVRIKNEGFFFYSSIVVIILTPFSFILSQPVDRLMGYMLIYNLLIIYYLFDHFLSKEYKKFIQYCVLFIYFLVVVIWIYFGDNSFRWLPYKTYFF